jgi:hypothetical protein
VLILRLDRLSPAPPVLSVLSLSLLLPPPLFVRSSTRKGAAAKRSSWAYSYSPSPTLGSASALIPSCVPSLEVSSKVTPGNTIALTIRPSPPLRCPQVYVGNLPWTTTWQELKDQFRVAGEVTHADVVMVSPRIGAQNSSEM